MNVKRDLFFVIGSYVILITVASVFSLKAGLGKDESAHLATSGWMYARRCLMICFAVLLPLAGRHRGIAAYGWKLTGRRIAIAVVAGICIGFGNPGGFNPQSVIALLLAAFHTFATELYFRAYLITTLSRMLKGFWPPIFISALMYGFSYLTVYTIWYHELAYFKYIAVCLFTLIGLIMGYGYKKTQSFPVPWIMHFFGVLRYQMLL